MKLKPLFDKVVVKEIEQKEESFGGNKSSVNFNEESVSKGGLWFK